MRRQVVLLSVLVSIAIVAGCVGQTAAVSSDISIRSTIDPAQLKPGESAHLFLDIENKGDKDIHNVIVDVFDVGLLSITGPIPGSCIGQIGELRPFQLEAVECDFQAPTAEALVDRVTPAEIKFRTTFRKDIGTTFVVNMLTLEELRRLERIGGVAQNPQSYSFEDGQVSVAMQFNKAPPFIAGETVVGQLSVRNIGSGDIRVLDPQNFIINQTDTAGNTFKCQFGSPIYSANGIFPPITCIFTVPADLNVEGTYPISITMSYDYELRNSVQLSIKKYD